MLRDVAHKQKQKQQKASRSEVLSSGKKETRLFMALGTAWATSCLVGPPTHQLCSSLMERIHEATCTSVYWPWFFDSWAKHEKYSYFSSLSGLPEFRFNSALTTYVALELRSIVSNGIPLLIILCSSLKHCFTFFQAELVASCLGFSLITVQLSESSLKQVSQKRSYQ